MRTFFAAALLTLGFALPAQADDDYVLTLKNHRFDPKELTIPANTKVTLTVKNEDSTGAEFESHDLNREKVVAPNSYAIVNIGPLEAGSYSFVDEFHEETATGTLIVK